MKQPIFLVLRLLRIYIYISLDESSALLPAIDGTAVEDLRNIFN